MRKQEAASLEDDGGGDGAEGVSGHATVSRSDWSVEWTGSGLGRMRENGEPLEVSLEGHVRHRQARQEAGWCRRCS